MPKVRLPKPLLRACYTTLNRSELPRVDTINASHDTIDVDEFRKRAFLPEQPILISPRDGAGDTTGYGVNRPVGQLPATFKWFSNPRGQTPAIIANEYLSKFGDTILPYELVINSSEDLLGEWVKENGQFEEILAIADMLEQSSPHKIPMESFHHFTAPFVLFLRACRPGSMPLKRLYIAQAQIADLPKELQDDLPTPRLVQEAGNGDIYDANLWLGIPPTYTPLHKDPNPNLFVQLASSKRVRLFPPRVGSSIFYHVQQSIGQQSFAALRGHEMMEGPEKEALDQAVWGDKALDDGLEVTVHAGDALFIPKGWWHSFKSVGDGVTGSVNWWFR